MVTSLGRLARIAYMTLLLRHNLSMLNMAESESNVEQRYAIKFMFKEGESASNVYIRLNKVYGEHCMSRARVFEWFKRFKTGRTSIDNEPRSGRPSTAVNEQTIAQVDKLIRGDRRLRVKDIMTAVNIGAHAADEIIHERLRFNKVCARWVPHHLTDDNKEMRLSICQDLFERYDKEGEQFLRRIITGDETWVHQFEPENKQQSLQWRHVKSPPPRKFKAVPSMKKVMATVFWDASGVLLIDHLPNGQTINADRYIATLKKLKRNIRRKRPGLRDDQVLLLHDNARSHSALRTQEAIQKLGWTTLPHPPYSPDLAPSDFHLFGMMKKGLKGNHYASIIDVQRAAQSWLRQMPTEFYERGIFNLVPRWQKCIAVEGDYVEK
jgi:[histone H3]-lysine36 N-dimethyltransferase SETMAR